MDLIIYLNLFCCLIPNINAERSKGIYNIFQSVIYISGYYYTIYTILEHIVKNIKKENVDNKKMNN